MKTTLRLLDRNKQLAHELVVTEDTDTNDILTVAGKYYLFEDQGNDENGPWEEWVEGRLVDVTPRLG